MKGGTDYFHELIGEDLSGTAFVRDYLQLQFSPPMMLNAYTPVTIRCGEDSATSGEKRFPDLLLAQLNKYVWAVEFTCGSREFMLPGEGRSGEALGGAGSSTTAPGSAGRMDPRWVRPGLETDAFAANGNSQDRTPRVA